MMTYTLSLGSLDIPCNITFKKVKNVNFRIKGDGSLRVSAPLNMNRQALIKIIHSKEQWIISHVTKIHEKECLYPPKWIDGERVSHLGQYYTIRIKAVESISMDGNHIIMPQRDNPDALKQLFFHWQKEEAKRLFSDLLNRYFNILFSNHHIRPHLKVKQMKSRWGSFSPKTHRIHLNQHLMGYPMASIEYVILHELTHLIYLNHSKKFYLHIKKYMPDYQQRIKALKLKKIN